MKQKSMLFTTIITLVFFLGLTVSVIPVSGVNVDIGVKAGDWVKYEVHGTVPQIEDYEWVILEVKDVSGTEIKASTANNTAIQRVSKT